MKALALIVRRAGNGDLLLFAVPILNFLLLHLAPGDIADTIAGDMGGADAEVIEEIRARFGLDRPFHHQLGMYLARLAQADPGTRSFFQPPVTELILERLPATLLLVITAQVLAIVIGTVLGVVAARKPNGATSHAVTLLALFGYSAPVFRTGIMLIILFCSITPVFPVGGMVDVRVEGSWLVRGARRPAPPGAADGDPGVRLPRTLQPPRPGEHAGRARLRLRADRAGQGLGRVPRDLRACAAQRPRSGGDTGRPAVLRDHVRRGARRDGVQLAGARVARAPVDPRAGHADDPRDPVLLRPRGSGREALDGPRLPPRRPPHQAGGMESTVAAEADHPNVTAAGAANATAAGRPGAGPGVVTARHPFAETAGMFFRNYSAVAGLAVIAGLVVIVAGALAGPYLYPTDPFEMVWSPLSGPGEAGFLLGTDYLGRDLLAGIVHGGRVTLAIGLSATVVIGITVGALSGYYGGWVEEALMRHRLRGRRRR